MTNRSRAFDETYFQITQSLAVAALNGASDLELLDHYAHQLLLAGLKIATIEVCCDVVDPARQEHFLKWTSHGSMSVSTIASWPIFEMMLLTDCKMTKLSRDIELLLFSERPTDGVAFASHLAPDATLGFFDDVLSCFTTAVPNGFSDFHVQLLQLTTPIFALAVGARLNAGSGRKLLETYLGQGAATAMLDGRIGLGEVERIRAIVLYCDLADFTTMTESLEAGALIDNLNLFFDTMTRAVSPIGGQVSGHVGDAIVLYFPIDDDDLEAELCVAALAAARQGLASLTALNALPSRITAPKLRARIGVDIGNVVHGNIGSPGRLSFTIIGSPVNRAARLQALARQRGRGLRAHDVIFRRRCRLLVRELWCARPQRGRCTRHSRWLCSRRLHAIGSIDGSLASDAISRLWKKRVGHAHNIAKSCCWRRPGAMRKSRIALATATVMAGSTDITATRFRHIAGSLQFHSLPRKETSHS